MLAIDTNPHADQMRAILRFRADGWKTAEICRALRISQPTLWRREREILKLKTQAQEDNS